MFNSIKGYMESVNVTKVFIIFDKLKDKFYICDQTTTRASSHESCHADINNWIFGLIPLHTRSLNFNRDGIGLYTANVLETTILPVAQTSNVMFLIDEFDLKDLLDEQRHLKKYINRLSESELKIASANLSKKHNYCNQIEKAIAYIESICLSTPFIKNVDIKDIFTIIDNSSKALRITQTEDIYEVQLFENNKCINIVHAVKLPLCFDNYVVDIPVKLKPVMKSFPGLKDIMSFEIEETYDKQKFLPR